MDNNDRKISFRQKNATVCPVCSKEFYREEMLTGGGRLIAGKLTDELRKTYQVSQKFGKIHPLSYMLTVCPSCLYTAYPKDFDTLPQSEAEQLRSLTAARKSAITKYFGDLNFDDDKNLMLGAASFMLAVDCYTYRNKKVAPTFKNAVSSIRAAWMFNDLAEELPESPYKKMSVFFYKKALQYYTRVLDLLQSGEEPADAAGNMGPDSDKNWGYEGILYISAYLTMKFGSAEADVSKRLEMYETSKKYLSRLFGMGKSSKSTPSELLLKTKDLYDKINAILDQWKKEQSPASQG